MSAFMVSLVLAVLTLPSATTTIARRNCSDACGYGDIPYPFGLGPWCSLPGFNLTCAVHKHTNDRYLLLGMANSTMEVEFPSVGTNPFVRARISYMVTMIPSVRDYTIRWEAPGRPFAISGSSNMSLIIFGCGITASMFLVDNNSAVDVGSCSAICAQDEIMEKLPEGTCDGIGCCSINIRVNLRAFTLNITRIVGDSVGSSMVHALVASGKYQFYFKPVDALRSSLVPSLVPQQATLDWSIPYHPNCKHAMEDRASYACVSKNSKCQDSRIGGYFCSCLWGEGGNAYVDDGCPEYEPPAPLPPPLPSQVYGSIQPGTDCPTSCGNVSIPFPFGTKLGCFAAVHLYLACMPGTILPVLELTSRMVVSDISLDDGVLHIHEESEPDDFFSGSGSDSALYSLAGKWGVVKWAVDKITCEHAKVDMSDYRCLSSHSECVDVTDDGTLKHLGYRCKCSSGFQGNPYIKDGCTDTNECLQPDKYICNGICHNKFGSYTCTSSVILGVSIGLGSGGGILLLAAIVAIITRRWKSSVEKHLRKRHFRKNRGILLQQLTSSNKSASEGTKLFSLDEIQQATNNFERTRVVGRGGHGTVYKGILADQRVVAIKKSTHAVMSEIDQFINEVAILSQINHRNVVKLHGCCLESEVPLLIYEFISNGTLYDLLHRPSQSKHDDGLSPLSWEERLRIATEIAAALAYLHSAASVSILHRDVKSMNVLLTESRTAKVSDFGASRLIPMDQTHLVTTVQGTFGYLDPEYYHNGMLNEKSDVYSFGVILVELLTRRKPIIENEHDEKQNLSSYFLWAMREGRPLQETLDVQILLEEGINKEMVLCVARLAEECLSLTRWGRPTMKDVEMRLQLLRVARMAGQDQVVPRRHYGAIVPVIGEQGSRQFSQEKEFMSSLRVPR
ncbi:wall-associated receptor kinase 4-like [Hordeum vulgare subsp. vulgare]|nr:wall-associated receptor kinase 4-like [Hordeum vulgare subsp. vulgare]